LLRAADTRIFALDNVLREERGTGQSWEATLVSEMRVLIVDDEEDMRALVRATIEVANEGLKVAGEAADGEAAVNFVNEQRPEVVVMDQRMPGASGLDTAKRILSEHPDQAIVLFSSYLDRDVVNTARNVGVRVCLPKDEIRHLPDVIWSTESV
jgi:response regulator NasT